MPGVVDFSDEPFVTAIPVQEMEFSDGLTIEVKAPPSGDVYVIQVLEGSMVGQDIVLAGRKGPFRAGANGSISFGVEQHTVLTYNPGNPVATQHRLGPRDELHTINGQWSDKFLGQNAAKSLVAIFRKLCKSAVTVRVVWDIYVCTGIVKRFRDFPGQPTGGAGDRAWEMSFEWTSTEDRDPPPVVQAPDTDFRTDVVAAADKAAALEDEMTAAVEEMFDGDAVVDVSNPSTFVRDVTDQLVAASQVADELAAVGEHLADAPVALAKDADRAIALTESSISQWRAVGDLFGSLFHQDATSDDSIVGVVDVALFRGQGTAAARAGVDSAWDLQDRAAAIARPPAFATVTAVAGTDLRRVALRFYGDADLWQRIAKANGLEDSKIPEGLHEIVVPLALPDALDDRMGDTP